MIILACQNRETLRVVLSTVTASNANVVLGGSTAGGVGAFNIASWLLETFDQARLFVSLFCLLAARMFCSIGGGDRSLGRYEILTYSFEVYHMMDVR